MLEVQVHTSTDSHMKHSCFPNTQLSTTCNFQIGSQHILFVYCDKSNNFSDTLVPNMDQDKYTLTWHAFPDHLRGVMKAMMTSEDFADVTLVSDEKKTIKAHKSVLSACSPVFMNILSLESQNSHPVIYLRGIQYPEIESILQFMYLGEAKFYEERMNDFIMVAKNLEIKELSKGIESSESQNDDPSEETIEQSEENLTDSSERDQ